MGRSRSFASTANDQIALFRLGFPVAPARKALTKPRTVTRRIIMQKARRHTLRYPRVTPSKLEAIPSAIVLRPLVGAWFQVLLPPLAGVLFIFQSPYSVHYRSSGSI
jgi:hypothetical protein